MSTLQFADQDFTRKLTFQQICNYVTSKSLPYLNLDQGVYFPAKHIHPLYFLAKDKSYCDACYRQMSNPYSCRVCSLPPYNLCDDCVQENKRMECSNYKLDKVPFSPVIPTEDDVLLLCQAIASNSSLTHINLNGNKIGIKGCVALSSALRNKALVHLDLSENEIDDEGAITLAQSLADKTLLVHLALNNNNIQHTGGAALASTLSNLSLIYLDLSGNEVGDISGKELLTSIAKHTSLLHLDLAGTNIGNTSKDELSKIIKNNTSLSYLNLQDNNITDTLTLSSALAGACNLTHLILKNNSIVLGSSLSNSKHLKHLNVQGSEMGDIQTKELASSLSHNTTLVYLNVQSNNIGTEGGEALANALRNKHLEHINIADNQIGVEGATALANTLKTQSSLVYLRIDGNRIGQAGEALANALATHKSFVYLYAAQCDIDFRTVEALRNSLINNKVISLLGLHGNLVGKDGVVAATDLICNNTSLKSLYISGGPEVPTDVLYNYFQALKYNTNLQRVIYLGPVPLQYINNCFETNTTVTEHHESGTLELKRWITLNWVCKRLKAGPQLRASVPLGFTLKDDMIAFMNELQQSSKDYKSIKLVLLGHGDIGKTTLVESINRIQNPWHEKVKGNYLDRDAMKVADCEVSVWDFCGSLENATLHNFYISYSMVVYLVCYDLSATPTKQYEQICYWLDYLHSSFSSSNSHPTSKWRVIVVGLRADLHTHNHPLLPTDISTWQRKWHNLPLLPRSFFVSAQQSQITVKELWETVKSECVRICKDHATLIPTSYHTLLQALKSIPESDCILSRDQLATTLHTHIHTHPMTPERLRVALKYLDSIGQIVVLMGGTVCTIPKRILRIAAHFISPDLVRMKVQANVGEILSKSQIGIVLGMEPGRDARLTRDLPLLELVEACYRFPSLTNHQPAFLFPTLTHSEESIQFTIKQTNLLRYAGMRFVLTNNNTFLPGFFYRFVVALFDQTQYVYWESMTKIFSNGVLVPFRKGELIVVMSTTAIAFLIVSENPQMDLVLRVFRNFITNSRQFALDYDRIEEQVLCSTCIKSRYCNENLPLEKIGISARYQDLALERVGISMRFPVETQHCPQHQLLLGAHMKKNTNKKSFCAFHASCAHDFSFCFQEETEGEKSAHSREPNGGIVEVVFERMSLKKRKGGEPVFVFSKKMCTKAGHWSKGITVANVIVLFISSKLLYSIEKKAYKELHDDLFEYECALLQHKLQGVPVVPIYIAEITGTNEYQQFEMAAVKQMPDVPHARGPGAQNIIDTLSVQLPESETVFLGSVAKTLREISLLEGIFLPKRGEDLKELDELVNILMNTLENSYQSNNKLDSM